MRLTVEERRAITDGIGAFVAGSLATLYLYGSRTDDSARGGDIDLLLLVDATALERTAADKYRMLASIKATIGDRRIDLTVAPEGSDDPFVAVVLPSAIELKTWR